MERPPPAIAAGGVLPERNACQAHGGVPRAGPGLPAVRLPPTPGVPSPTGTLSRQSVAGLLSRVAGRRSEPGRRWAPSGGNLGSVELYVLSRRGSFRYDDEAHALIACGPTPIEAPIEPAPGALHIVMVGRVDRLSPKYGPFAHRLAHLDAGCAATQLVAIARAYGLDVTFVGGRDDRLSAALGLRPPAVVMTAIALVQGKEHETCP
nr:nitroreductase family protein [Microbispora sp. ATCC PTA-5024]